MHVDPSAPSLAPRELRQAVRAGVHAAPTAGYCSGFVQANVVILPRAHAWDFLLLCQRNPRPLPLLEVYDPGAVAGPRFAPESDIRTDCPKYVVLQKGQTSYVTDISPYWREDLVTFLIGCSFTFETGLLAAGVPVRHIEMGRNVPMYRTCLQMTPRRSLFRAHGGQHAARARFPGERGGPGHRSFPRGARRARQRRVVPKPWA